MQTVSNNYKTAIDASTRRIKAKVDLFEGSTLVNTFTQNDELKSITLERTGEDSKFFGFGVSHKVNVKLRDINRIINISTANHFKISIGVEINGTVEYTSFPAMRVTEVNRAENSNELSITAYDILNDAKTAILSDTTLSAPYSIKDVADAAGDALGASGVEIINEADSLLKVELPSINGDVWTSNGITFTRNADGTLTLNGTNDGVNNSAFFFYNENAGGDPLTLEVGETYNVSYFENDSIMFVFFTGEYYRTKDGQTFEATEEEHVFKQVYIQVPKGDTTVFDNYVINPTLRKKTTAFNLEYTDGANFEGTETLQEVLKAIAEATQSIYYIDANDKLIFKRLDKDGAVVKEINKNTYITLDSKTNKRLQTICSATELGDNVSASISALGSTQYVRDNAFYELRQDIDTILNAAIEENGGLSINQFECLWRGDMALEIGDKIGLTSKDDKQVISYLLNDTLTYDGTLSQKSFWNYEEGVETASNPSSLGAILKQTYARVDKVNKQIDIVASQTAENSEIISAIQVNTENINASVQKIEKSTSEALENVNNNISELTTKVEATITDEDVSIAVKSALDNGVSKVETSTGFKFNEEGLTISKTGSEMTTRIDEDGMNILRDGEDVLTANHEGVNAYNLHAKTYLIVGESSRFEDYENEAGETRTGCFWIGGAN
jgi:hypothetical protein